MEIRIKLIARGVQTVTEGKIYSYELMLYTLDEHQQ